MSCCLGSGSQKCLHLAWKASAGLPQVAYGRHDRGGSLSIYVSPHNIGAVAVRHSAAACNASAERVQFRHAVCPSKVACAQTYCVCAACSPTCMPRKYCQHQHGFTESAYMYNADDAM